MQEIENIEHLYELYQKGILKKSEFKTKKAEIIGNFGNRTDQKFQLVYVIYAVLFGWFGVHNFYIGRKKRGWAQLTPFFFLLLGILNFLFLIPALIGFLIVGIWALCDIWLVRTDGRNIPLKPSQAAQYACGLVYPVLMLLSMGYGLLQVLL